VKEFHFWGNKSDWWIILESILGLHIKLVIDDWYQDNSISLHSAIDNKAKEQIESRRRVFLWRSDFSISKPEVEKVGDYYSVLANEGGPMLQLTMPVCYLAEDGLTKLGVGSLAMHPRYFDSASNTWIAASDKLKAAYNEIKNTIKTNLIRHKATKYIMIGKNAFDMIKDNRAVII
jgi:hypothetical protein